ncbi:MAG TPA: hypothetical protein VEU55_04970 [Gemmatimonadales bacterium]|nr:hypothetical protein [Gemmatimonadales bacterium]
MTASAPHPSAPKPSTTLLVASTLAWVGGVLNLLVALAVGIPQVAMYGRLPLLFLLDAVLALALCVAGYWLRKRRRKGGILATVVFGLSGASHLLSRTLMTVGFGITLVALLLTLAAWKELE